MGFFYSFTETILHSLWQSFLLVLSYVCINIILQNIHPLQKRNFLYSLLVTQCIVSIGTFILYFTDSSLGKILSITKLFYTENLLFKFLNNYSDFIFFTYLIIICLRFSAVYFQWSSFKKNYSKNLIRPNASLKVFAELKAYQLGIKRKIAVWYSHKINAPITFGYFKPLILLPFSLINNISTEEVETIILHELAHIKSKDYLLNWLLMSIEILYFFNPFIKIMAGKIRIEREKNCDLQVINFKYERLFYAQVLLKIARKNNDVKLFHLGAVKKVLHLFNRIQFFSDEKNFTFKKENSCIYCYLLIPFLIAISLLFIPKKDIVKNNITVINTIPNTQEIPQYFEVKNSLINGIPVNKKIASEKIHRNKKVNKTGLENNLVDDKFTGDETIYRQASMNDTYDSVKEIIYNVETQYGKVTQSYKLIMIKGKWTLQPQWMLTETNADSCMNKKTDSSFKIILPIQ